MNKPPLHRPRRFSNGTTSALDGSVVLFDTHAARQTELVDTIAERIQTLGGIGIAMAADVAERR
jgi:hypothetical protein